MLPAVSLLKRAPAGTVDSGESVLVTAGDRVQAKDLLIVLRPVAGDFSPPVVLQPAPG